MGGYWSEEDPQKNLKNLKKDRKINKKRLGTVGGVSLQATST